MTHTELSRRLLAKPRTCARCGNEYRVTTKEDAGICDICFELIMHAVRKGTIDRTREVRK